MQIACLDTRCWLDSLIMAGWTVIWNTLALSLDSYALHYPTLLCYLKDYIIHPTNLQTYLDRPSTLNLTWTSITFVNCRRKMPRQGPVPHHRRANRIGGWLPHSPEIIRDYVNRVVHKAKSAPPKDLSPPMKELYDLYISNPIVYMLFNEMLTEVPTRPPYNEDPSQHPEIYDVETLMTTIDFQIQNPIIYNDSVQIGTPINAILDWPMGTKAGFAAFLRDDVNACFQTILQYWSTYLQDPTKNSISTVTTGDGGWLSAAAQNDPASPGLKNFLKTYQVPDHNNQNYGFTSWDQFFTRHFNDIDNLRPIAGQGNSSIVASAAESTPFYIQNNLQLLDQFWAKDQHYSLTAMLGDPTMAAKFVGGTAYQAFLSADSYHNWHAPVSGTYLQFPISPISGTYYSEPLLWGFDPDPEQKIIPNPDAAADARSQGYIANVAKRAVAYIQPDDTSLGLIALVMIGMAEVSSIEFDQKPNNHVEKGDEIGRFHFGGSTHVLVFGPGVTFTPSTQAIPVDPTHNNLDQPPVPVRSNLGTLVPKSTA